MSKTFESLIRKPEFHQAMIDPVARIDRERKGMPVHMAEALRKQMGLSAGEFSRIFGIKPATYKKKVADKEPLAGRYGDAVADLGETLAIAHNRCPPTATTSTSRAGLPSGSRSRSRVSAGASRRTSWTPRPAVHW